MRVQHRRVVSALAALALTGTGLAACTSAQDPPERAAKPRYDVPAGPQDVPAPGPQDRVALDRPVAPRPVAAPERPNLLMITMDDATASEVEHMPYLQRLVADQGVTLENGLAPTPICVPARASLLTGQYAGNHGAVTIRGEGGGFAAFDDADTLPVWLRDSGYRTMFVGKYLNGYGKGGSDAYVPPGWDEWYGTLDPSTYTYVSPSMNENGTRVDHHQYVTDLERDRSVELIERAGRDDHPWYMWVNHVAPHHGGRAAPDDPVTLFPDDPKPVRTPTPAKRDENSFASEPLPDKPSMFEEDASDKVLVPRARTTTWSEDRRAQLREAYQQRLEALQSVDRSIRDTVQALRRTGQLDSTYVVVTSDNGYALGEHNLAGKLWYFDEMVNVPMIIRGPGLPKGVTSTAPVTNADWAPTFAALAGATPTREVDGTDVLPYLTTRATTRVVPLEAYPVTGTGRTLYTGVVVGPWTFVKGGGKGGRGRIEVYHRGVDPWENHNLARDPRYREQREALRRIYQEYAGCAGAECPAGFYR